MAQGQAIQALKRAYDVSRDQKYLDTANALLNSFFVEVKEEVLPIKQKEMDGGMKNMPVMGGLKNQEF